ncbi:MAG: nucleotidyl transferase AbiEii/AbiGii toxin family protein [Planctomycetes bacterium]|nr:nucleotidyl transferase AbiEii/AbiGii toxin family protein [Planctomycetota bacterium]
MFEDTAAQARLANPGIVEKDFWVCWTLHRLYSSIPNMPRLLFKGGTSLSKCFRMIHRFSEDIDLGIERQDIGLVGDLDPMAQSSRNGYQRAVKAMRVKLNEYGAGTFMPAIEMDFRKALGETFGLRLEVVGAENVILFKYPRALDASNYGADEYVDSVVRLELGARSDHEPVAEVDIRPYVANLFADEFAQQTCSVIAQAPERTLLEKALILHAGICKGRFKERSSRHAYDLAMMHREGTTATVERALYEQVAHHKFVFGDNPKVRDAPKDGILIVPAGDLLRSLEADYRSMQPMFFTDPAPPAFGEIVAELTALETALNDLWVNPRPSLPSLLLHSLFANSVWPCPSSPKTWSFASNSAPASPKPGPTPTSPPTLA